mmetsp:Transcript_22661/g.52895  ORF Transcript_22661/g.52895 Transcript_22661/m.52895 type:complete len:364 (+) Transcript_22661:57-1148(+)
MWLPGRLILAACYIQACSSLLTAGPLERQEKHHPAALHALKAAAAARELRAAAKEDQHGEWEDVEHGAVRATTAAAPAAPVHHDAANVAQYVKGLEGKVQKVLRRLESEKGATEELEWKRGNLTEQMRESLAMSVTTGNTDVDPVMAKFFRLHEALAAAQSYLKLQTQALDAQQQELEGEVQAEEVSLLHRMLKQRRSLPIKSQLAVLRRGQFSKNRYAEGLAAKHDDATPLYSQLEARLPASLAARLHTVEGSTAAQKKGHLEAAGSEGRVHIVSSRIKNSVDGMLSELEKARSRLAALADGKVATATDFDKTQARHVLSELDPLLEKARKSHDLSFQLEAMDEVQRRMQHWMQNSTTASTA